VWLLYRVRKTNKVMVYLYLFTWQVVSYMSMYCVSIDDREFKNIA